MGRTRKIEIGVTVAKPEETRGGPRENSGRKPSKKKLKMICLKLPLQAIKECARFARARKLSRNKAAGIMLQEFADWMSNPNKLYTWGGEQILIPHPPGNTK